MEGGRAAAALYSVVGICKHEDVHLHGYEAVPALAAGLGRYFPFYNGERPHQSLGYRTPAAVYGAARRR